MRIAVIGGGAAGMMAALSATESELKGKRFVPGGKPLTFNNDAELKLSGRGDGEDGIEVILLERNEHLGVKVLISGGGRCNLTTGEKDLKKVLKNYPRGGKFLRTALYGFGPEKVMDYFREGGVKLKVEEDNRVFPVSDDGKSVVGLLENRLNEQGVKIMINEQVLVIERNEDKKMFSIRTGKAKEYLADRVVLTTGGSAYKQTGSTGDGYTFAEKLGHKITPLAPSLSALVLEGDVPDGEWEGFPAGVSFKDVLLKMEVEESGNKYERRGPAMFTHKGITGPAVFALSSMAAYEKFSGENFANLYIDFFPDDDPVAMETKVLKLLDEHGKKRIGNILDIMLPHSLCGMFLKMCGFDAGIKGSEVSREFRKRIVSGLKKFQFKVTGRFAGEEFVTAGGVDLNDVDPKTMESKIVPGLYFAGEILDIDGFTGGFNLQSAWSTGYLAGKSAANI